jgi:very-short-patch-repair endonuclease
MRSHTELARVAERQYGIVTFRQLRGLGFSKGAISRSSEADRLRRIHRGVYAVGHARLSRRGRCLAAVLACGSGAPLSHASAAWLWGVLSWCPTPAEVSVASRGRQRRGINVHRAPGIAPGERGELDGIPVTSLPRTLLDLAGRGSARRLQQAIERAERLGLLDLAAIDASLHSHFGRPGTKRVLEAIEIYRDPGFTRSRAELLFLDIVRKAGLPRPATNTWVAGHEIDAYWERERFAVEVDGWDTHRTRAAFEADPVRQEDLKLAGIDSIRLTARRIEQDPRAVGKTLAILLSRRGAEFRDAP